MLGRRSGFLLGRVGSMLNIRGVFLQRLWSQRKTASRTNDYVGETLTRWWDRTSRGDAMAVILKKKTLCVHPWSSKVIHSQITVEFDRCWLVVSTPLKNISQIGNLPQIGVKIKKNIWNHHLGCFFWNNPVIHILRELDRRKMMAIPESHQNSLKLLWLQKHFRGVTIIVTSHNCGWIVYWHSTCNLISTFR